jgi:hypothetical protein
MGAGDAHVCVVSQLHGSIKVETLEALEIRPCTTGLYCILQYRMDEDLQPANVALLSPLHVPTPFLIILPAQVLSLIRHRVSSHESQFSQRSNFHEPCVLSDPWFHQMPVIETKHGADTGALQDKGYALLSDTCIGSRAVKSSTNVTGT